ncbi:MAG: hypothetical protein GW947_04410 [Candidatus Pacebacteria bacterium]|nr:hypothetical protein [Candidatus Paceibacterota bacterium]PIR59640.1 MAG: hypothetical protein COU68_04495 [Candidatus Pacebacteria bacterium CG10_big_fil_rev_8_21_14_0_10_45_6]
MRSIHPLLVVLSNLFIWTGVVFAQANGLLPDETLAEPKIRPVTVTAFVADHISPAIPILISPENGHSITTGRPQFRWYYTTDNIGVAKYQLFIDGELFQDNIPITSQTTSEYVLDYVALDQIYGLIHSITLADGVHTWKIKAYDVLINNSESATWTFTVDTVAPAFVVTKIVDKTTSISAQDVSTIPVDPIEIPTRNPILVGTGEANSSVVMTVRLPSGEIETHTFAISASGTWDIQLFDLPRGETIYLDFTIIDQVGHISTLIDLPLIIAPLTISIPGLLEPININPPTILEPLFQPTQIIEKITYSPLDQKLPSSLQTASETLPIIFQQPSRNLFKLLLSVIGLILISSIPLTKITILLARFGRQLSLHLILEVLKVIGLLPKGPAHGIVFEVRSQEPVPFATIIFQGNTSSGLPYSLTKLTDKEGLYGYHELPKGVFQASALSDNFSFPTLTPAPQGFLWNNFYRGQAFEQTTETGAPSLFLPMDANEAGASPGGNALLLLPARNLFVFVCVMGVAVLIPSVYNLLAAIIYLLAYGNRKWRDTKIELVVGDPEQTPQLNTIVRAQLPDEPKVRSLSQANASGIAVLHNTPRNEPVLLTLVQHERQYSSLTTLV